MILKCTAQRTVNAKILENEVLGTSQQGHSWRTNSPCAENKPKSGNFGNSSMNYEKVPPVQNRLLTNMWIS